MLLPDPDKQRLLLTSEDFLRSIDDKKKRRMYATLIAPLSPLNTRIVATWRASDGMPDLRVVKNAAAEETELRDLVNTVCLAEGLFEYCFSVQSIAETVLTAREVPRALGPFSIAKISFMWAYAHEVFHFVRRHALVEKHFGSDPATKHALEYDADLCSTAAIYRFIQFFAGKHTEIGCKRRTLIHLYWFMRMDVEKSTSTHFTGTDTHQHAAARLQAIVSKLAMMHRSGPADPNLERPTTRKHLEILFDLLGQLERAYMRGRASALPNGISPLGDFSIRNLDLRFTSALHRRWDEISPLIDSFSALSRTTVDNESSIAFIGENFSLPRSK